VIMTPELSEISTAPMVSTGIPITTLLKPLTTDPQKLKQLLLQDDP